MKGRFGAVPQLYRLVPYLPLGDRRATCLRGYHVLDIRRAQRHGRTERPRGPVITIITIHYHHFRHQRHCRHVITITIITVASTIAVSLCSSISASSISRPATLPPVRRPRHHARVQQHRRITPNALPVWVARPTRPRDAPYALSPFAPEKACWYCLALTSSTKSASPRGCKPRGTESRVPCVSCGYFRRWRSERYNDEREVQLVPRSTGKSGKYDGMI